MAGPWFTVQENGSGWHQLDRIWLSNGDSDIPARVEIRLMLDEPTQQHAQRQKHARNVTRAIGAMPGTEEGEEDR